jgi:hypothetical protein
MQEWAGPRERHPVEIDAVAYRIDGTKISVRLTNFSEQGCRIDASDDFKIGERLSIAVPRMGQLKARVRWALPGSAGAQFVTESDFQSEGPIRAPSRSGSRAQ